MQWADRTKEKSGTHSSLSTFSSSLGAMTRPSFRKSWKHFASAYCGFIMPCQLFTTVHTCAPAIPPELSASERGSKVHVGPARPTRIARPVTLQPDMQGALQEVDNNKGSHLLHSIGKGTKAQAGQLLQDGQDVSRNSCRV